MATTYDKASLVMIPSGVKEDKLYSVKPTDGSGDFTFSRGTDTATRVNSSGLIEKERANLLLQSNSFDTTWTLSTPITLTSGQTGYDGSSDAWLLQRGENSSRYINQSVTYGSGVYSYSVYAKKGTADYLYLWVYDGVSASTNCFFNLATGVVGQESANIVASSIEAVGATGWYRCSITLNTAVGAVRIYPADANGLVANGGTDSSIYIQDAMLNAGLVATDYIETTTAAVYEGITDNLPRLDYHNPDSPTPNSCPSLLLEPSRTNLLAHSEYYDGFTLGGSSISTNYGSSPEGVNNATALIEDSANTEHTLAYTTSAASSTAYTASVFVKPNGRTQVRFGFTASGFPSQSRAYFDIQEGTILSEPVANSARIEPYADGWYRISITNTTNASANISCILQPAVNESGSYQGDGTSGILVYGSTHELGSYPTSYIPTYGTSASRAEDSSYKTSATDLIGQTEGSFIEVNTSVLGDIYGGNNRRFFTLSDGTTNNRIVLAQNRNTDAINLAVITSSTLIADISTGSNQSGIKKIGVAYANNDFVMYVNGVQIGTDTSGGVPPCSRIGLGVYETGTGGYNAACPIKQALLFKTRLTNAELAALTTI